MNWLSSILRGLLGHKTPGEQTMTTTNTKSVPDPQRLIYPGRDPNKYRKQLKQEVSRKGHWPQGYEAIPDDPATMEVERRTYCNYFVKSVASWFQFNKFDSVGSGRAADITDYMIKHPTEWGSITYKEATDHACKGRLVIAGYIYPKPASINPGDWKASGHVCIVAPQKTLVYSMKWGKWVSRAANVGGKNFYGKGLNWCFGKQEPELFVFKGLHS